MGAAELAAACVKPAVVGRGSRLGVALVGLAREVSAAGPAIAALRRATAALPSALDVGGSR